MKKKGKLEVVYIPYKCMAINFPHYELAEKVGKEYYNIFCFFCGDQKNEGVKLLRRIIAAELRRSEREKK